MTERQAIESTYFDTFSSFRRVNVKDTASGQTKQEEQQIVTDVPCAISKNNLNGVKFGNSNGETNAEYTLFHAPELDVKAGDKIIVSTPQGQKFTCYAGKPFCYASHAETKCSENEPT